MKIKNFIIISLIGSISIISCSDFLETKPLTEYSEVDVWESEDPSLIEAFISQIYMYYN